MSGETDLETQVADHERRLIHLEATCESYRGTIDRLQRVLDRLEAQGVQIKDALLHYERRTLEIMAKHERTEEQRRGQDLLYRQEREERERRWRWTTALTLLAVVLAIGSNLDHRSVAARQISRPTR